MFRVLPPALRYWASCYSLSTSVPPLVPSLTFYTLKPKCIPKFCFCLTPSSLISLYLVCLTHFHSVLLQQVFAPHFLFPCLLKKMVMVLSPLTQSSRCVYSVSMGASWWVYDGYLRLLTGLGRFVFHICSLTISIGVTSSLSECGHSWLLFLAYSISSSLTSAGTIKKKKNCHHTILITSPI